MANLISLEPVALDLGTDVPDTARTGTVSLVVRNDHPMAAVLADLERRFFPEAPTLFDIPDADDIFMFLVISVDGCARHVARISAPAIRDRDDLLPFFITDLVDADPLVSMDDVRGYYQSRGIDIGKFLSVETQFRLGEQMEPVRSADLTYLSLFRLVQDFQLDAVVAHLNAPAITSFQRIGLDWHPFAGQVDLRTPTVKEDGSVGFDEEYRPICLQHEKNAELLSGLAAFTPDMHWV